jgi:hypothetical protein
MTSPRASAAALRKAVAAAIPPLLALGDASGVPRAPGQWSRREILGHLVDSAINNYSRFVRGQLEESLVFPGYAQEAWVRVGGYQEAQLEELVMLWQALNSRIAAVMEATPEQARSRLVTPDAGGGVTVTESLTLEQLMSDYVAHLNHHLEQILS